jgi:hypothetical protein
MICSILDSIAHSLIYQGIEIAPIHRLYSHGKFADSQELRTFREGLDIDCDIY